MMGLGDSNLMSWIEHAYGSISISVGDEYIIGDKNSNKDGEAAIIMAKDTPYETDKDTFACIVKHKEELYISE